MTTDRIAELERIANAPRELRRLRFKQLHRIQRDEAGERLAAAIAEDPEYPAKVAAAKAELAAAEAELAVLREKRLRKVPRRYIQFQAERTENGILSRIVGGAVDFGDAADVGWEYLAVQARRDAAWGKLHGRRGLLRWPAERLLVDAAPRPAVPAIGFGPKVRPLGQRALARLRDDGDDAA